MDKTSYKVDDSIVVSFKGTFLKEVGFGDLVLHLDLFKKENESINYSETVSFDILECDSLDKMGEFRNEQFVLYLFKDSQLTDFNNKIKIRISDVGDYVLIVSYWGATDKHPYGGNKDYTFNFSVAD